jgi:1-acyl-sn-glycerol-3-phosphate acyltransferase
MELAVIVASGWLWLGQVARTISRRESEERWIHSHQRLLTYALAWLLFTARRCLGFHFVLSDSSLSTLTDDRPTLVLARHGGPGDSFVLVHLFLSHYDHHVRIVLKDALQWDPALDIVLNRLGCCFLTKGAGADGVAQVSSVAAGLGPRDALLLFPEGANWTPGRRWKAIRHLSLRRPQTVRSAQLMEHVLPPRLRGVAACLDARPSLEVAVVAHAGLDDIVSARQLWDVLPFDRPMTARVWKASPAPSRLEERESWLTTEWAVVDEWVDAYRARQVDQGLS